MKVAFEPAARDELDQIFNWIAKDSPRSARRLVERIEDKVMQLASPELVHMGRLGMVEGTRELIEGPYIVVYRVDESRDEVIVVSVVHGARDRQRRGNFEEED
jgi:plasmid stabilization system protein ParE